MLPLQSPAFARNAPPPPHRRLDLADIPDLSIPPAFAGRSRVLGFRHIDTDVKRVIFCHGRPSCAWGSARHSALPSDLRLLTAAETRAGHRSHHGHNVELETCPAPYLKSHRRSGIQAGKAPDFFAVQVAM